MTTPLQLAKDYVEKKNDTPIWDGSKLIIPSRERERFRCLQRKQRRVKRCATERQRREDAKGTVALRIGLNERYFYSLKKTSPKAMRAISLYGRGDIEKGYKIYLDVKKRVSDEALLMIQHIKRNRLAASFSVQFYGSKFKIPGLINNTERRGRDVIVRWDAVISMNAVLKDYLCYLDEFYPELSKPF